MPFIYFSFIFQLKQLIRRNFIIENGNYNMSRSLQTNKGSFL